MYYLSCSALCMYDDVMNIRKSLRELRTKELYERRSQLHLYIDTTFAVAKRKPDKNSGLYRIWTLDLCDTSAALLLIELTIISLMGADRVVSCCVHVVSWVKWLKKAILFCFILFIFYFISIAQKNTKKKHWRYANTNNKNVTTH